MKKVRWKLIAKISFVLALIFFSPVVCDYASHELIKMRGRKLDEQIKENMSKIYFSDEKVQESEK